MDHQVQTNSSFTRDTYSVHARTERKGTKGTYLRRKLHSAPPPQLARRVLSPEETFRDFYWGKCEQGVHFLTQDSISTYFFFIGSVLPLQTSGPCQPVTRPSAPWAWFEFRHPLSSEHLELHLHIVFFFFYATLSKPKKHWHLKITANLVVAKEEGFLL